MTSPGPACQEPGPQPGARPCPVHYKLLQPSSTSAPSTEGGLLTSLVLVREGGRGTAVSCVQEKTDQLQNLLDLLKAAEVEVEGEEHEAVDPLAQFRLELGLNNLKLEMFSRVGALDLAEKQELKQRYGREEVSETGGRVRVRDVFTLHLGGAGHYHTHGRSTFHARVQLPEG